MSNPTGSNWTTNVNRAKTKRWVEAKSYSYDGDDWGDADEYGEYDEPKVSAKPTGLRKATAPVSSQGSAQIPSTERERSNSFGRDDERRAFSGPTSTAYAQPQSSQAPPILYSQEHPPPSQRSQNVPSAANNVRSPMLTSSKAPYDASAGSMISNTSTLISGRRKPSMGQADQSPMVAPISTTIPPPAIGTPDKPSTPTIIRPADIYRRIQEEREKESVSQGSSRPSLSGLTRDESPANKSDNGSGQAQVGMLKDPSRINATPNFASVNSAAPTFADTNLTTPIPFNPSTNILRSKGPSASPKLPEITGLSGFGDDFGSSFMSSTGPVHKTTSASTAKSTGSPIKATEMPSLNVLPSNVDQQQSLQHQSSFGYKTVVNQAFEQAIPPTPSTTSGSGVDRSNSDSTNNISPIISREASSAVRPDGMANISSITEEPAGSSRPGTSGSATKRGSGGPPHQEAAEAATIMPGYRKETGTPGANNTPARTPAIKSNKEIMKPQEAEVAATTPISGDRSPAQRDRSSSPTKSRVRDLVDKIDSAGNSRRGSQASLSEKVDLTSLQRPSVQPKDSFRPSLPGAWASYTTNPNPIPNLELKESTAEPEQPGTNQTPVGEPGEDPFSKAAAAGSALAGALAAAASVAVSAFTSSPSETTETAVHASKIDTTFHPETARLALPRNDSDTTSSIMPTPSEMRSGIESKSEYFDTMQPLRSAARISPITILATSPGNPAPVTDDLSTKSSPTDLESDKLRKEIVRELSPKRDGLEEVATQEQQPTTTESHVGYSSIYDSYLEEEDGPSRQASEAAKTRTINPTHLDQAKTVSKAEQVAKQSILSSTSDPLENIQESTAASEDPHNLNRQYSWEAPLQDLTLSPNFGSKTEPENGAGAQLSLGTPTAAPRDSVQATVHQRTPSAPLDINKQLPLPATLDNNQIVAPPEPQQRTIHQITKKDSAATVLPLQPTSKSLAFREIMAIQSVPQRIQAFDQTRKTFANTETGLFQWIQATISELPEHEDLLRNGGTFPAVIRPHQTPTVPGSQAMSSNPRPSLGATTGKSAKGKDLFHSAGVLTGKTSNAARGLFAKGKSKWRGSAEKASKRFRGLSLNSNGDSPSKLSEQRGNTLETNSTVPYYGDRPLPRKAPTETPVVVADAANIRPQQSNKLLTNKSLLANSFIPSTNTLLDSPTLGRSKSTAEGPIIPVSDNTSSERNNGSLAQPRTSMDVSSNLDAHEHRDTSSLDSHRDASNSHSSIERKMVPIEPQVRLTIHQNQMRSFGEEFPADLITPTKYHLPQNFEETPRLVGDTSTDQTPTQADFPKGVIANGVRPANPIAAEEAIKKTERRGPASTLWLDTVGTAQDHNFNGPASPDYALRPQQEPEEDALDKDLAHGRQDGQKQFNSLSFIQFDPVPSEDLALNVPVTPKRISIVHDRSDSGASSRGEMQDSESSFTDYPAAEDFGALSSKSFEPDSLHRHERSVSATSHSHQNAGESLEASRHISQSSTSTTSKISALDSVKQQLSGQVNETVIDDTAAADQNALESQENTEIDSTNVLKQDSISGDARESNETHSYIKQSWHPNRRSLLGLGSNAKDTSTFPAKTSRGPKFSLISSMRKRTATDLSDYQAGQLQQSAMTDNESTTVQQVTTIVNRTVSNTSERRYGEKGRKKRFSGFSSFISKAKPHVSSMGNSIRGRSPTLFGPAVGSKIVNTSEIHEANPLARSKDDLSTRGIQYQTQQHRTASVDHDSGSMAKSSTHASGDQPKNPSAYIRNYTSIPDINSNQGVIISRITAPPQQGIDYKTVYSPEFFGDQPPEGYYGPEEDLETQARQPETTTVAVATRKPAAAPIKTFDPEASAVVANLSLNLDTSRPREKEQSRIVGSDQPRPPPLPPKDYPHHSVTTTTTTNHILNGPTRTTTEVGIGQSQQAHYESRLRGRQHEASNTDVFVITKNIPGSPLVHKAKTRTVTRVLNGRSNSPSSRNPKTRSSLPIVPPLNIHKRPSIPQDETRRVRKESVDSQVATAAVISAQNRGIIPHLTLDTRTAPNRPVPVEQFSGVQNAVHEPDLSATSHALINTPSHPFIARRAVSSQGQASGTTIEDHTLASNPNPSRTLDRDINPRKENDTHPLTARAISGRDKKESNFLALEDPVMIVPPLTIRKSPEPSIKRSPVPGSQAITKIPSQDGPTSVLRKAPPIPLPSVPSRLSLHSPVLKDSPTLPRPTPPSSSRAASRMMPPLPQTPHSLTKSPLTEGKEVVLPPERAVSPLPRKKASSTVRSMTPVEKMKDEPGVNEVLKEKDESEEEIIMSSTAYPGQEWRPDYGYDGWDGSE